MRSLPLLLRTVAVALTIVLFTPGVDGLPSSAQAQPADNLPCALPQAAFCDTFDAPAGTGNRSGQLDGIVWGVSRETGNNNSGQNQIVAWAPTRLQGCSGTTTVQPPNDIIICDGQLREAVNDNETVTTLAMYPKQPFDFAGRTGIVTFDVSNDSQGTHSAWPEFWMTDQPVPAPFTHFATWVTAPRNGFGIRFGGAAPAGQGANVAPGCPSDAHARWSVAAVVVSRNYVADDMENGGATRVTDLDCVISSTGPGNMNHVELHISQSQIDVYATDAGTTAPLHYIAAIKNANLTLTRGLIWIEDAHYNAGKFNTQGEHTFAWDNVGFDGPVLPRDLAYDVLDPLTRSGSTLNLGWVSRAGAAPQLTINGVSGIENAAGALLTFNFNHNTAPNAITYVVNGNSHSVNWPYPDRMSTLRTLGVPVPLSDLVSGTNTVSIFADQPLAISNVDVILVAAGGVVGVGGAPSAAPPAIAPPAPAAPVQPTPEPASPPPVAAVNPQVPGAVRAALNANGGDLVAKQVSFSVPDGVVGPGGGELNLLPLDPESVPAPAASFQPTEVAFAVALTDSGSETQISQPSRALALQYRLTQDEINQSGGDLSRFQIVNWSGDQWVSLACTTGAAQLDCAVPHLGLFALVLAPAP